MADIGEDKEYDVKVKLKAETRQAENDIREFNRKTQRLGSLANQGEYRQGGVLSNKQVEMYKSILKEMESLHTKQQQRLLKAEQTYTKEVEREQKRRLERLERLRTQVDKNQSNYDRVSGGLKGAGLDGSSGYASPTVVDYHQSKLNDSIQQYESYKQRLSNGEDLPKSLEDLGKQVESLKDAMEKMDVNHNVAGSYQSRINDMKVENSGSTYNNAYRSLSQLIGSLGLITSVSSYMNYTKQGMNSLRSEEQQANVITQKTGLNATENADSDLRDKAVSLGEKLGFNAGDTLALQQILLSGGNTSTSKLEKDTQTAQQFSRAYEVDASTLASGMSSLQKVGTLEEGEMQRFANILAGAISKSGMSGREEEMMRTTLSLASSMSQGLSELSEKQLMQGVALQTQLGDAVPTLKGDRGTDILTNLNDSLKGGMSDQNLKLLMGKGTEFVGLQGEYQLRQEMEKGLTNENLQRMLVNGERMFGTIDPDKNPLLPMALQQYGVSLNEYNSMYDSGLLDDWKNGNFLSTDELQNQGMGSLAEAIEQSGNSATSEIREVEATSSNFKGDNAKVAEEIATESRGIFQGLPDWAKSGIFAGSSVVGSYVGGKLLKKGASGISGLLNGGTVGDVVGGSSGGIGTSIKNIFRNAPGALDDIVDSATISGASLGDVAEGALKGSTKLGKALPVIGTVAGIGLDRAFNPESSWWRTGFKTVGGLGGGALGAVGGTALAGVTGGTGAVAIPAATVGGAIGGESLMNSAYTGLFGDEDLGGNKKGFFGWAGDKISGLFGGNGDKDVEVDTLEVRDIKSLTEQSSSAPKDFSRVDKVYNIKTPSAEEEHTIKIVIDGEIKGMSANNETEVKNSIIDFYMSNRLNLVNQYFRK